MLKRTVGVTYVEEFESIVDAHIHDPLEVLEGFPWVPYHAQVALERLFRIADIRAGAYINVLTGVYIIFPSIDSLYEYLLKAYQLLGDEESLYIFQEAFIPAVLYFYHHHWCAAINMDSATIVWSFVISLHICVLVDNAKWAYLGGFAEERQNSRRQKTASWLRECVLQLGPTFIKLGRQGPCFLPLLRVN